MLIFTVLVFVVGFALQPPTPRARESKGPPPHQQAKATQRQTENVRGSQESPAVVKLLPIPKTPEETAQEQADREREATANWWLVRLTGMIALFTLGLVVVGALQWLTYRDTLATNKVIERAYVSMSHYPVGLDFIAAAQDIRATIKLTNSGHTPADVIGYNFTMAYVPLIPNPARPPVPTTDPFLFIMPNDYINVWANIPSSMEAWHQIQTGAIPAFLIGWVVYKDRFGKRHRSGYGRRFVLPPPGLTPAQQTAWNNLVFVDEPGYNYEEDLN